MASGRKPIELRAPLVWRAPAFSTSGRERGVIAIAASVFFNFLFLWIHSTATSPESLWTEVKLMVMPSAASAVPRETAVGLATQWDGPSTSHDVR